MVVAAAAFAQEDITDLVAVLSPHEHFKSCSIEDVAAAQKGDRAAFSRIYRAYFVACSKRAYYLLRDVGLAEQVAQDVFEGAIESITRTAPGLFIDAWLYRLTFNRLVDVIRSLTIRPEGPLLLDADPASPAMSAEDAAEVSEAAALLRTCMGRLMSRQPEQAAVLLWHYREGVDYVGLGQRLGKTKVAVRSLLWRARNSLVREYDALRLDGIDVHDPDPCVLGLLT
jgi:RNA polymerase sigma-70 factor (ECF subfamily)